MVKRRKRAEYAFEQFSSNSKRFKNELILHQDDTENSIPENKTLYGREKEVALLEKLLHEGIVNQSPASIFVSGPPGTGKTLTIKTVLQRMLSQNNVHSMYINCASENTEWDILTVILNNYNKCNKRLRGKKLVIETHKMLTQMKDHIIVVLDEIDYVKSNDRNSLCSMFQWPVLYNSVSLIGISNTLDVMELLKHKLKFVPELIVFAPYNEVQLHLILSKKLKINDGSAIELCARKVAAITGDARKAVQVARRSLSINLSNESTFRNVFGTLTSVYGSPILQAKIPLQQKILLATMLRLAGDNPSTTVEKGCLLSTYKKLCEFLLLPALEMNEMHEALSLLESQSILKLKSSSYQLLVDKAAVGKLIADPSLISQINTLRLDEKMRPLSDEEAEIVFKKLAHYIGNHVRSLVEREDAAYCFRLHKDRVYYCTQTLMRKAACISREPLLSFGTCLGKFTKTKKFRMHITALDYIAPYAKCKIWVKPNAEQQFLYGNNVLKSGMNRMTEGVGSHQGVVVYNMNDLPLGFGVTAKSTTECRRADLTSIVVLHQADLGEYIRNEAVLT